MIGADLVRAAPFRLALTLAAALAVTVVALFGFVYWKTDDYLTARSDQMIMTQLNVLSLLHDQRLLDAIDEHLRQDARGVQFAGLFRPDGSRITGNIAKVPADVKAGAPAHRVEIMAARHAGLEHQVVQGVARQLPDGVLLVLGRHVDETSGIAHVIGQALALGLVLALASEPGDRNAGEPSRQEAGRGGQPAGSADRCRRPSRTASVARRRRGVLEARRDRQWHAG